MEKMKPQHLMLLNDLRIHGYDYGPFPEASHSSDNPPPFQLTQEDFNDPMVIFHVRQNNMKTFFIQYKVHIYWILKKNENVIKIPPKKMEHDLKSERIRMLLIF